MAIIVLFITSPPNSLGPKKHLRPTVIKYLDELFGSRKSREIKVAHFVVAGAFELRNKSPLFGSLRLASRGRPRLEELKLESWVGAAVAVARLRRG